MERRSSLQGKFGLSYILIIAAVLALLNTYPVLVSQDLVFHSKAANMQSSVSVIATSLSPLERLTEENVGSVMLTAEEAPPPLRYPGDRLRPGPVFRLYGGGPGPPGLRQRRQPL